MFYQKIIYDNMISPGINRGLANRLDTQCVFEGGMCQRCVAMIYVPTLYNRYMIICFI